jgi:hypothetical protein
MLATIWFSLLSSHLLSRYVKVKTYKTIILPVVLYGCETWPLILREEHRQTVLGQGSKENTWTKRDDVMREWRKLHSEELRNLYSSSNIIR